MSALSNPLALFTKRLQKPNSNTLLVLAALLGLTTAIAIWLFREGIELFHRLFTGYFAETLLHPVIGAVAIVVSLALAGAVVGWMMERFIGAERHHGVAGIIESVAMTGGRLRYARIPFKAVASALSLGAGASVGPEDPSVQIGSNIGSMIGQRLRLSDEQMRLLVAAGAASAIAAAFKAPIAGVFFALEVILNGAFETRSFGVVVLSAVVSSALTQAIEPAAEMGPFNYTLGSILEIPLFIPLGLILGIISALFIRAMYWQHDWWHHHIHLPRPAKTALAGALVGLVAIFLPQIMGTGRETMSEVLSGEAHFGFLLLLILGFVKLLMTTVSMAGGFVGGIFAPTLFVGTMLGSAYGQIMRLFVGNQNGNPQVYAIAGMAAVMAGVVRCPITAIMLVFELTNDYRLILPIMLATVVCVFMAERLAPDGMYIIGLKRQGVYLPQGREVDLMQGVVVREVMIQPAPNILETASLLELRDALRQSKLNSLCVVNEQGKLVGIVTLSDLQRAYLTGSQTQPTVGMICSRNPATIAPDATLWTAIKVMEKQEIGRLPVVDHTSGALVGLVGRRGVMRAYTIAIERKLQDQHTAEHIRLNTLTGGHVFEFHIDGNSGVSGKRIADIQWPQESVVAAIHRGRKQIVPHGSTEIQAGDALTIIAEPELEPELAKLLN
ncbi:MAG: chloride channel protein [Chloroflexi bacterium]|nr:chloride channel protein [Chloroflexota bacterium]MCC6896164.1 chloride channel protein [Anaerolineae bacterium]